MIQRKANAVENFVYEYAYTRICERKKDICMLPTREKAEELLKKAEKCNSGPQERIMMAAFKNRNVLIQTVDMTM